MRLCSGGYYCRSKFFFLVLATLCLTTGSYAFADTAAQVQRDLMERRMAESVMAEDYRGFLDELAEFRRMGGNPVPDIIYYEALALDRVGEPVLAAEAVQAFLGMAGRGHRLYGESLVLADALGRKAADALARRDDLARLSGPSADLATLYQFVHANWDTPEGEKAVRGILDIEEPLTNRTPDIRRDLPERLPYNVYENHISLSPDGERVAVIDYTGRIYIWFIDSGQVQWQWTRDTFGPGRKKVAFSPDPAIFAIGWSDGRIQLYDLRTGKLVRTINQPPGAVPSFVTSMSFSADGGRLAALLDDKTVLVHDVASGRDLWRSAEADASFPASVALSPDGRRLVNVAMYQATVWDVETRTALYSVKADGAFGSAAFSADGATFAIADREGVHLRDAASGAILRTVIGHGADPVRSGRQWPVGPQIVTVGFSRSGRFFTAGGGIEGFADQRPQSGSVYVYEADGRLAALLTGHGEDGNCVPHQPEICRRLSGAAISPDGGTVVTAGYDGFLRVWRLP